jgi:hypothetical protein
LHPESAPKCSLCMMHVFLQRICVSVCKGFRKYINVAKCRAAFCYNIGHVMTLVHPDGTIHHASSCKLGKLCARWHHDYSNLLNASPKAPPCARDLSLEQSGSPSLDYASLRCQTSLFPVHNPFIQRDRSDTGEDNFWKSLAGEVESANRFQGGSRW